MAVPARHPVHMVDGSIKLPGDDRWCVQLRVPASCMPCIQMLQTVVRGAPQAFVRLFSLALQCEAEDKYEEEGTKLTVVVDEAALGNLMHVGGALDGEPTRQVSQIFGSLQSFRERGVSVQVQVSVCKELGDKVKSVIATSRKPAIEGVTWWQFMQMIVKQAPDPSQKLDIFRPHDAKTMLSLYTELMKSMGTKIPSGKLMVMRNPIAGVPGVSAGYIWNIGTASRIHECSPPSDWVTILTHILKFNGADGAWGKRFVKSYQSGNVPDVIKNSLIFSGLFFLFLESSSA